MVMTNSSQAIAGDGVQHRAGKEAEADSYKQNVQHAENSDAIGREVGGTAYKFEAERARFL
jgi:hypothetical protein